MQNLKSKLLEKFQIKNKVQTIKSLPSNPAFLTSVGVFLTAVILSELKIRPLGVIFLLVFCFWLFKSRSNLRLQIPPDFENRLEAVQKRIVDYRQARPTMFCAITSACLASLAVVGHFVSGSVVVLTGLILAGIISTKHNIKIVKIESADLNFCWSLQSQEYDFDDEFVPEENDLNMFFLEKANDLSSRIDDTEDDESKSDEVPSELLIPDVIPEVNESSTDDDHDDLLPIVPVSKSESHIKNSNPATDALVKYSQSNDAIEFKKGHFKRDSSLSTSSSSSEESLSKGLQFPDHTAVDGPKALLRPADMTRSQQNDSRLEVMQEAFQEPSLGAIKTKLIPYIMTGLVQGVWNMGSANSAQDSSTRRLVTALDSSDESDFEILEREDFQ